MAQFDVLLRQGLVDANLAQYERILQQIETETPDFSPQYRRKRMRLLAVFCPVGGTRWCYCHTPEHSGGKGPALSGAGNSCSGGNCVPPGE